MNSVFEIHITVSAITPQPLFQIACNELQVKCITIDLPAGQTKLQPMTGSFHRGSLLDVQRIAGSLGNELTARGFDVVRTKIEQHGRFESLPGADASGYFEFHAKLPANVDVDAIQAAGGYLSANARNPATRFLTFRERTNADARFQSLLDTLAKLGIPVRNKVREYCVHDSNPSIDEGWITS